MRALRAGIIAVIFAVAGLVIVWQVTGFGLGHWMQVHLGITNEPGPYYGFFSGSGSDIGEVTLIAGVATLLAGLWHRFNCHNEGCPRIGVHALAGGAYLVCRKHHKAVTGHPHHKLTTEFLAACHREHLARPDTTRPPEK